MNKRKHSGILLQKCARILISVIATHGPHNLPGVSYPTSHASSLPSSAFLFIHTSLFLFPSQCCIVRARRNDTPQSGLQHHPPFPLHIHASPLHPGNAHYNLCLLDPPLPSHLNLHRTRLGRDSTLSPWPHIFSITEALPQNKPDDRSRNPKTETEKQHIQ